MPKGLYVGSGGDAWPFDGYEGFRLDINPEHKPDFVASMTDMGEIGTFDFLYCGHALEHLYPHQVGRALAEFLRVLSPEGKAVITVPDLEDVRPTDDVLYVSPAGPIAGLDLFYGLRAALEQDPHMAHHCGFTSATLERAMRDAGFRNVSTHRLSNHNLMGVGIK